MRVRGRAALVSDLLSSLCASVDLCNRILPDSLRRESGQEWTKGTWFAAIAGGTCRAARTEFEEAYARRVARAYPPRADGTTVLPFLRLFFIASRAPLPVPATTLRRAGGRSSRRRVKRNDSPARKQTMPEIRTRAGSHHNWCEWLPSPSQRARHRVDARPQPIQK